MNAIRKKDLFYLSIILLLYYTHQQNLGFQLKKHYRQLDWVINYSLWKQVFENLPTEMNRGLRHLWAIAFSDETMLSHAEKKLFSALQLNFLIKLNMSHIFFYFQLAFDSFFKLSKRIHYILAAIICFLLAFSLNENKWLYFAIYYSIKCLPFFKKKLSLKTGIAFIMAQVSMLILGELQEHPFQFIFRFSFHGLILINQSELSRKVKFSHFLKLHLLLASALSKPLFPIGLIISFLIFENFKRILIATLFVLFIAISSWSLFESSEIISLIQIVFNGLYLLINEIHYIDRDLKITFPLLVFLSIYFFEILKENHIDIGKRNFIFTLIILGLLASPVIIQK